ncbi:hypothetical protein DM01DRAFT_1374763 [Hesseltinella vesiculosa]|uniref:Uncharacterized protein n=1 Tax=Hesseltinella vesiculosa TaxID=101127 RepID=A0A1X2GFQ4_9FUNG|nr:hypothetical protein DM01DRAFT_1374763 [Hesseltinella vesiculosa]
MKFMKTTKKSIILVVLDYAGLTTVPPQVTWMLEEHKRLKYIAVHHGYKIETLHRDDLLNDKNVEKFACRKATVKRSQHG